MILNLFRIASGGRLFRRLSTLLVMALLSLTAVATPATAQDGDQGNPPETTEPADQAETPDEEPPPEIPVREIIFPVVGPVTYSDTFGACRGSRCSRSHKGADLFGAKLAPLVAAADGTITFVRRSATGTAGNTVIIRDDEGWRYLYLHLNNDSPGTDDGANPQAWILPNRLRTGDQVKAGDVIGYLGDSGNAERTPNHLHFEIRPPGQDAINPTPSIEAAEAAGRVIAVAPLASTAEGRAEHEATISAWYRALLKREPTSAELFAWSDRMAIGFATKDDLIADITMAPPRRDSAGSIYRSFHVAHQRRPDLTEIRAWLRRWEAGADTETIIGELLESPEWADTHGTLTDAEFIEVLYRNARGRPPTAGVRNYWTRQLAGGRARASMAAYFVDSYGLKNETWHALEVTQAFRAALDRLPTDEEYTRWIAHLDDGGLLPDIVDAIRG